MGRTLALFLAFFTVFACGIFEPEISRVTTWYTLQPDPEIEGVLVLDFFARQRPPDTIYWQLWEQDFFGTYMHRAGKETERGATAHTRVWLWDTRQYVLYFIAWGPRARPDTVLFIQSRRN